MTGLLWLLVGVGLLAGLVGLVYSLRRLASRWADMRLEGPALRAELEQSEAHREALENETARRMAREHSARLEAARSNRDPKIADDRARSSWGRLRGRD